MGNYVLRTETGHATAKLDNAVAQKIIQGSRGHFDNRKYKDGVKCVFIFDDDFLFGVEGMHLYIFKDMRLVPEDY